MSEIKSDFIENIENGKMNYGDVAGGRLRLYRGEIDLSEKTVAAGDTVKMLTLPEKGKVVSRRFGATVSLGTSTVSVGDGLDTRRTAVARRGSLRRNVCSDRRDGEPADGGQNLD